uniref:TLC domain-containing protein n=1 Tax=Plectus sambesii TaxID=2011161 RepID=A0A914VSV1_9BILA
WLPNNVTWEQLKGNAAVRYPQVYELKYTLYFGVVMLFVRLLCECFVFLPIGHFWGWSDRSQSLPLKIFQHANFGFAGKAKFKRVAETAWRFVFYLFAWLGGIYVMYDQPQVHDVNECWRNYPNHPLPEKVWW